MDADALKQWILRRLNAPIWKVELCEEHVDDAIEWAKRWFAAKKGSKGLFAIDLVPGQVVYDLDCDIDTILEVAIPQNKLDLSLIFSPFTLLEEKIPYDVFASGGSGGLYSSYVQSLGYVKVAKRILSAEFEWFQEGQKLFIAGTGDNSTSSQLIMRCKTNTVELLTLKERDHDLIKRYSLAKAREDIAFIRGKYGDYPGAQGTTTMNWAEILEAARTELEKLEEEIFASAGPMGMLTG